jgi:hypothetical protein
MNGWERHCAIWMHAGWSTLSLAEWQYRRESLVLLLQANVEVFDEKDVDMLEYIEQQPVARGQVLARRWAKHLRERT